jgi:hypothetical protein
MFDVAETILAGRASRIQIGDPTAGPTEDEAA